MSQLEYFVWYWALHPREIQPSWSESRRELQEGSEGLKSWPNRKNYSIWVAFLKGKKIKDGGRENDNIPQICKRLLLREEEKILLPCEKQKK